LRALRVREVRAGELCDLRALPARTVTLEGSDVLTLCVRDGATDRFVQVSLGEAGDGGASAWRAVQHDDGELVLRSPEGAVFVIAAGELGPEEARVSLLHRGRPACRGRH
jgi:hypothetical protein